MPQAYFPPLDKCLAGEERLLSWKTAYRALGNSAEAIDATALEEFLTDPESLHYLVNALCPFSSPSQKTKGYYETKTAPINVSQSTGGGYDLEELKKDARWLSEKMGLEELVALRAVVLEWQTRAEDALRTAIPVSVSGAQQLALQPGDSMLAPRNGLKAIAFDSSDEHTRRGRQLRIHLEEKSHILEVSVRLVEQTVVRDPHGKPGKTWLDDIADMVTENQCSTKSAAEQDAFCVTCIQNITEAVQTLGENTKWPEPFKADEEKQLLYASAVARNVVSVLRLLLANIHLLERIPSPSMISSWFTLMGRVNFFQDLAPSAVAPDTAALQCLVSTISLTILQLPTVLTRIQESAVPILEGVSYPQLPDDSYIRNDACIKDINLTLYRATQESVIIAAPAIYGWSIITSMIRDVARMQQDQRDQRIDEGSDDPEPLSRRRASRRDFTDASVYEKQYHLLQDFDLDIEAREDPPSFFARTVVDRMGVYPIISRLCTTITEMYSSGADQAVSFVARLALFDLVREGTPMVTYGAEVLEAILAVLSPDVPGRAKSLDDRIASRFVSDQTVFCPAILDQAISRYPFELSPLLRLLSALSPVADEDSSTSRFRLVPALEGLPTMTVMVPEHFRSYTLDHEEENANSMTLTEALPLFVSKQSLSVYGPTYSGSKVLPMRDRGTEHSNVVAVPLGAAGTIVKESRPLVFQLEHSHSGLEYLGLLLSTILPSSEILIAPMVADLDRGTAAEIIELITALLAKCMSQDSDVEEAHFILGRLAFALQDEQDIVTVVADILEMELLSYLDQSTQEGSLDLLIACADFLDRLIGITPERVWSILARSSLLGINGGANALAAVVGASEVTKGRFRFLAACVNIYSHLISDAVTGLVRRKAKVTKAVNRFDSPLSFQDATPERTMTMVLSGYSTVMIDAWQSLPEWRFTMPGEKTKITTSILKAFEKLLSSTYGIALRPDGIASVLHQPSTEVLEAFVSGSGNQAAIQPFTAVLAAALVLEEDQLPLQQLQSLRKQTLSALRFLTTLIRTAKMVDTTGRRANSVASQLLNSMPFLASLFVIDHSFKSLLGTLLGEIVQAVQSNTEEPPSLLGQLSTTTAKSFLTVISHLDGALRDIGVESAMWDFLAAVMSSKQQWFALYLLTGTLPKERLKDTHRQGKDGASKNKSLLAYSLDQLASIANLAPERATAMLKFVASAQNTWIWATNEVRSHSEFLKNSLEWLNNLHIPSRAPSIAEEILSANEHQMAAYLCDILAVNLHASNEIGDKTLIKMLPSKLSFLSRHGMAVTAYKRSLHLNLAENFARKFPACGLTDFEKTLDNRGAFGRRYYYDVDFADEVLDHEAAWHGASNGRYQGFSDEFARANVNLSLVDAQKNLLKSWRFLATTLCECVRGDASLQSELAQTVERCLSANVEANLEQPGMDEIVRMRAEMAFIIISQLVNVKSSHSAIKTILSAAWDLVRSSPADYDVATSPEDLIYYRTILQVLYLAIQPHIYMAPDTKSSTRESDATDETKNSFLEPDIASCLVQIMMRVIAPGFRALCGNLHNDISLAAPGDFALITALLQAILSVPGIAAVHHQIAEVVSNTSIVRGVLSLYSWSDHLAEITDQDPIYGEIAIMLLLSLSTVREVAEQMALDGALVQLSSANLSGYFRKPGGKGPFSEPRRMFVIWTEGLLPLCLNLLDAVGPPIAAEVANFLNAFPQQLQRASVALENREATRQNPYAGALTLSLVSEANSLCLIARILASDTARGAADGIDAAEVPVLGYDYQKVKEEAAGLARQKTSLASRIVPIGEREEAWKTGGAGMKGDDALLGRVIGQIDALLKCFGREE